MCASDVMITELDGCRLNGTKHLLLHILRYVDYHRTWPTAAGKMKGLLEDSWQFVNVSDQVGMFHDRQGHAVEISILKSHFADEFDVHLPRDCH